MHALAEAEIQITEAETAIDMHDQGHPLPAPRGMLAAAALSEANRYGANGWRSPGVGLWRDRARAEKIGARWAAVYRRLVTT